MPPVKKEVATNYLLKVAQDRFFALFIDQYKPFKGKLIKSVANAELCNYLPELTIANFRGLPEMSWDQFVEVHMTSFKTATQ